MDDALRNAPVDAVLVLPGIPDGWCPAGAIVLSALLRAGVRIYEIHPGFLHARVLRQR